MRLQEIFNHIETKIKTITHIQGVEWFTDQERSKEGISAAPCRVFIEIAPTPVEKLTDTRKRSNII